MNADSHRFSGPASDLTREITGSAFEVSNTLGAGLLEKPYENALVIELAIRGLKVEQQKPFPVEYKGQPVGLYIPDLIVNETVIIDTKVIEAISNVERAQMLNYLRITKLTVGIIFNFKRPRLVFERLILE